MAREGRRRYKGLREALPGLARVLHHFRADVRAERRLVGAGFLALLAEVVFRLAEPWPLAIVLDRVIQPPGEATSTGIAALDALSPTALLTAAAVGVVVIVGLRAAASYGSTIAFALAGNRVLTTVRARLYAHLQRLDLAYHRRARGGDLLTRLTGDVGRLQEVVVTAALPLVGNAATLVGMVAVMLWLDAGLTLVAVGAFPLFLIGARRLGRRIGVVSRKQRAVEGALASTAAESLAAIEEVQAYSLEAQMERRFGGANRRSLVDGVKAKKLSARLERSTDLLVAVGTGAVLFVGARRVLAGQLSPGDLVVFISYLKNAFKPLRDVAKYTGRLAKAAASGERIVDVLETTPAIRDTLDAVDVPRVAGRVELADLWFGYDPARPVLRGVDLVVEPGRRVALVGPSGGGKSSLVRLLLRLSEPTGGRILLDDADLRHYTLMSLRRQVAVVLQDSVLFAATVRENIANGRPDATDEEIERAARLANAQEFIANLPEGYDTIIGERGSTLSGGQRQRLAIARAALRDAPIVVLDEPTTGLDGQNAAEVTEALERLTQGRTTFLITHELRTAASADAVLWLEEGRVVERGTHDELLARGGRYAMAYRLQEEEGLTGPAPEPAEAML